MLRTRLRRLCSRRRLLEFARFLALFAVALAAISLYQTRGLPDGVAPPLAGTLLDGRAVNVGAGETASGVALGVAPGTASGAASGTTASANAPPANAATLVAFWATWCPVCKAEEGNLAALARTHRVVTVAMQSGDAAAVARHLRERELALPTLVDADGRHAAAWRVRGVPTHFIVDAAGNIRFRVVGYATTWGLAARLWWATHVAA